MPFLFENKLFTLSFAPSFRLLFRSSCSARTLEVNDAVSWFLMLLSGFEVAASGRGFVFRMGSALGAASDMLAFFLFFLLPPEAFFKE